MTRYIPHVVGIDGIEADVPVLDPLHAAVESVHATEQPGPVLLVADLDRMYQAPDEERIQNAHVDAAIVAQNIWDCSIQEYSASTQKMEEIEFDALLPGHFTISLDNGKRHIDRAAAAFRKLMIPRNAI